MLLFIIQAAGGSVSLFFFVSSLTSPTPHVKPSKNSLIQMYAQNAPHFLDLPCYSFILKTCWMIMRKGLIIGFAGMKSSFLSLLTSYHSIHPMFRFPRSSPRKPLTLWRFTARPLSLSLSLFLSVCLSHFAGKTQVLKGNIIKQTEKDNRQEEL